MSRIKSMILVVPVLAMIATGTARAQVNVVVYPSASYIATSTPEYYENRPVYYYNNNWYYRDHGRWTYYRAEPRYLRERRAHWGERRAVHGNDHGHERVVERGRYHYRR